METQETSIFDLLIWGGASLSFIGLIGLIWCIIYVARARRARLPDAEMRAKLKTALPMNLGALFLSVIGLMLVILGIFLA
ncbi:MULTISPECIES: hypothetical protein [unclassified Roseobacter]|uniref:hypothetical protein n=1 Tax=unclassified Roseobacter TaxID=196798 RepID=UPI0018A26023|nr:MULTISPECIES: hypothetical protein [unclassified Roseobacter]MDW3181866.1 hypothetical protein [Roseobacter sp.]